MWAQTSSPVDSTPKASLPSFFHVNLEGDDCSNRSAVRKFESLTDLLDDVYIVI
jgi:hypothetical protein